MKNRNNSINDSIFSAEYKIPYSKQSIESHLEESQEEINFIKYKLTQAYQKLEFQIQNGNDLEDQNEHLRQKLKETEEKYLFQSKENSKLKETLQVILKNRKILQEESEDLKDTLNRKLADKDKIIQQLSFQVKNLSSKCTDLTLQCGEKERTLKEYSDRLREESSDKQFQSHRQAVLTNKIQILEQQISKITEQKYIEVNRLRHELQLYHRSASSFQREIKIEDNERKGSMRRRQFIPKQLSKHQKFNTRTSDDTQFDFNKENMNSLQVNPITSLTESSISKWKAPKEVSKVETVSSDNVAPISGVVTEDQQLTLYQQSRKKAEQELLALEKIKRPKNEEREKMARLQRQMYHLDSDITGLKRKIRRKY